MPLRRPIALDLLTLAGLPWLLRRCRRLGWAALALGAGLGLVPLAQAQTSGGGLQIESLFHSASAVVIDSTGHTSGSTWFWDSALGLPPAVTSAGVRSGGLSAAARQTPDGFFVDKAAYDGDWIGVPGLSTMRAETRFALVVGTLSADTPLVLDFHFLGSLLDAGAYYAGGQLSAGTMLTISAGRQGQPLQDAWAFEDILALDGSNDDLFLRQSNGTDVQGIGLPQDTTTIGWVDFMSRGRLEREAMTGSLDFGLLQPGELFTLEYRATAWIDAEPYYAGDARADIIDPFALGGELPSQMSLQGLTLPMAPVPELPAPWLLLAGLGALGQRLRGRSGRPEAARGRRDSGVSPTTGLWCVNLGRCGACLARLGTAVNAVLATPRRWSAKGRTHRNGASARSWWPCRWSPWLLGRLGVAWQLFLDCASPVHTSRARAGTTARAFAPAQLPLRRAAPTKRTRCGLHAPRQSPSSRSTAASRQGISMGLVM